LGVLAISSTVGLHGDMARDRGGCCHIGAHHQQLVVAAQLRQQSVKSTADGGLLMGRGEDDQTRGLLHGTWAILASDLRPRTRPWVRRLSRSFPSGRTAGGDGEPALTDKQMLTPAAASNTE
jgi:hypothetical protein